MGETPPFLKGKDPGIIDTGMKQMPNVWLDTLTTFEDTLSHIENCLDILKDNANDADFYSATVKNQYKSDVMFMKQFFEKAETLARGK